MYLIIDYLFSPCYGKGVESQLIISQLRLKKKKKKKKKRILLEVF